MNETIGCPRCTYCAAYLPAGSTSAESLYCTYLRMHVEKVQARRNVFVFRGKSMVDDKVVSEAEFTAMIV